MNFEYASRALALRSSPQPLRCASLGSLLLLSSFGFVLVSLPFLKRGPRCVTRIDEVKLVDIVRKEV